MFEETPSKSPEPEPEPEQQQQPERADQELKEADAAQVVETPVSQIVDESINDERKVEEAATMIQATFRGYKTRKEIIESLKSESSVDNQALAAVEDSAVTKDVDLDDAQEVFADETSQKEPEPEEQPIEQQQSVEIRPSEEEVIEAAASSSLVDDTNKIEAADNNNNNNKDAVDVCDDNLDRAATKIQATFRGFKARKNMSQKKEGKHKKIYPIMFVAEQKKIKVNCRSLENYLYQIFTSLFS